MANAVAPNLTNNLGNVHLRVCAMRFKPIPSFEAAGDDKLPPAEDVLKGFTFEILKAGYVILVKMETASDLLLLELTAARTNDVGEIVRLEEGEMDGCTPGDPARVKWFERGAQYAMFWTIHKPIFKAVWDAVKTDAVKAMTDHPFSRFKVTPHGNPVRPKDLEVTAGNNRKLDILLYSKSGLYKDVPSHGMFRGSGLQPMLKGAQSDAWYVFARSDTLAALYISELVRRTGYEKSMKNVEHWMNLEAVYDVAQHAENGVPVAALDSALMTMKVFGQEWPAGPWHKKYFHYAYDCAAARVPQGLFLEAVRRDPGNDLSYQRAGNQIWEHYKIVHPAWERHGYRPDQYPHTDAVMNYFNFYSYGFRNNPPWWDRKFRNARQSIASRIVHLNDRRLEFMKKRATYGQFLKEIFAHYPYDQQLCLELHRSYIDATLQTGYRWWEDFPTASALYWRPLQIYADAAGTAFDKLGEIFYELLNTNKWAKATNIILRESVPAFEKFFERMRDLDQRFKNRATPLKRQIRPGMDIEVDFKQGVLTIKTPGELPHPIKVEFLVEQTSTELQELAKAHWQKTGKGVARAYRRSKHDIPLYSVRVHKVPFEKIHQWPAWISALGDAISLAVCIVDLVGDLKKKQPVKWDVWGKVAMNVFQPVGSIGKVIELFKYGSKEVPWFLKVMKIVGHAGQVLEALFNEREGFILVFSAEEGDVTKALERGDAVEATLYSAKGVVLLASAVPGLVALGGGISGGAAAAAGAAATPLAMGLAGAAVIVIGIEYALYRHRGPDDVTDPLDTKAKEALSAEFGDSDDLGPSITDQRLSSFVLAANEMFFAIEAR